MIVDDEEFCLSSMKAIMQQIGVNMDKVDECITGLEAVNLLQDSALHGVVYSLIFTDFNMPQMDGLEATTKMRKFLNEQGIKPEEQPVIIGVTGHAQ